MLFTQKKTKEIQIMILLIKGMSYKTIGNFTHDDRILNKKF